MGAFKLKNGSRTQKIGAKGERLALRYLRRAGYKLIEKNFCVGHKEIDLIMRRGDILAFIEVKTRTANGYALPQASVGKEKQRNIIQASKYYIMSHNINDLIFRYDIVEVILCSKTVNHIENAYSWN